MTDADAQALARNCCLWKLADGGLVAAGPTHDIRTLYPGAVPLFDDAHRDRMKKYSEVKPA